MQTPPVRLPLPLGTTAHQLMAQGMPYDSDAGRAWAGAITALMTGHAYATSARTAARMGPFAGFTANREPMLDVLRMHRAEVAKINEEMVAPELLCAAQEAWNRVMFLPDKSGVPRFRSDAKRRQKQENRPWIDANAPAIGP